METEHNIRQKIQNMANTYLQKCRQVEIGTWMIILLVCALLCIAVMMHPKFTTAKLDPFNAPDPCEMAELADGWLEYAD